MDQLQKIGTPITCPVVAIIKGDKLLIGLRHYTQDKWRNISVWTIPGGRCDKGEKIEETLRRETEEEVGISDLKITKFLGKVDGSKRKDAVYVFVGTTDQEPKLMEPEKFSEWKWQNINQIPDNFINFKALGLIKEFLNEKK
jgi:8-oxo-dGTP diphosphatase